MEPLWKEIVIRFADLPLRRAISRGGLADLFVCLSVAWISFNYYTPRMHTENDK